MKVSIIMSAYNTESTINKAIQSVLNQTHKDIELIIVEDKSTDSTLNIINTIKDNRILVIKHSVNQGAGVSRYDGVKHSTGDYTTFLDSDDYLELDCIEKLLECAAKTNADIVSPGYIINIGDSERILNPKEQVVEGLQKYQTTNECLRFLNPALIKHTLWDKVEYSKRRFVEDTPTLVKLIWFANKRAICSYAGYHYIQRENSLIHSASNYKTWIFETLCSIDVYNFMKSVGNEKNCPIKMVLMKLCSYPIEVDKEEKKLYFNELNEIKTFINNNI